MSYILDALRKADAQRERDVSRGIHAQPLPAATPRGRAGPAPRLATFGALAAGILVAAAAGWYLTKGPAPAAGPAAPPGIVRAPAVQPREPQTSIATAIVPSPSPAPAPVAPPAPLRAVAAPAPAAAPPAPGPVSAGLPPDAPKVAISGGVYSPDPAQRMLIVGGQVFNEGSEVAPGVTIDRIETRTAILKFRGGRYSVAY